MESKSSKLPYLIYGLAILLALLHQDFWYWEDPTLVFGFMPVGLAYHAAFSMASAGVWALAVYYAWPKAIEEYAEGGPGEAPEEDEAE